MAGYLLKRGIATLHRVHEKPDTRKCWNSKSWLAPLAILWRGEFAPARDRGEARAVPSPAKRGRPDSAGHDANAE